MRVFRATYRDRAGRPRESAKWYCEFKDAFGVTRRLPAFTDRRASEQLGRRLEQLAACRASGAALDMELTRWLEGIPPSMRDKLADVGLLAPEFAGAAKSLSEHLDEFAAFLKGRAVTPKHSALVVGRVRRVLLDGCKCVTWTDVKGEKVAGCLDELRRQGVSGQTINHYIAGLREFGHFLVKTRRASESPFGLLKRLSVSADRRRVRRALSAAEQQRLLQATLGGGIHHGLSGLQRHWVYRTILETGLRRGELAGLTVSDFRLDGPRPSVFLRAGPGQESQRCGDPPESRDLARAEGVLRVEAASGVRVRRA